MSVHPTAMISEKAVIDKDVYIGAYAVIGEVVIGLGCVIHSHVVIADGVTLGSNVEVFPGALIGKEPKGAGAIARQPTFEKKIFIDDACSIGPHAVVYYDVVIGKSTLLGDGASIREQCRIGSKCIISRYVTINYATTVGDGTKIMDTTHITGNMMIGSNVFISAMVASANDNIVRAGYGTHVQGPIIEDDVVVGLSATLLPHVRLGKGATIAAGSVVTKDVAPGTLVAGVPARFVRRIDVPHD